MRRLSSPPGQKLGLWGLLRAERLPLSELAGQSEAFHQIPSARASRRRHSPWPKNNSSDRFASSVQAYRAQALVLGACRAKATPNEPVAHGSVLQGTAPFSGKCF